MTKHIVHIESKNLIHLVLKVGGGWYGVSTSSFPQQVLPVSFPFFNSVFYLLELCYCKTLHNVAKRLAVPNTLAITVPASPLTRFLAFSLHICYVKLTNISSAPVLLGNPADDITTVILLLFFIFIVIKSFGVPRSPHVYTGTHVAMRTKIRVSLFISLSCVVCAPIGKDFWKYVSNY